jgi:PD-(D/E)XK nuclease superfamily
LEPREAINRIITDKKFQLLEDKLNQDSLFHILNVHKRELTHSAFLAWLLNPNGSHGMNYKPLKSFILQASGLIIDSVDKGDIPKQDNFIDRFQTRIWRRGSRMQ